MSGDRELKKTAVIAAPVEAVWAAWTTEDGLSVVSSNSRIDLRPGGDYAWFLDLEPDAQGRRGSEGSTIVSVDPPRELVFNWNFPPAVPGLRESGATTRTTVRLEPVPDGVEVVLTAVGWGEGEEWDQGYAYFDSAWSYVLATMRSALEGTESA